ncbi:hypothetical protein TNCV_1845691 [Trichonephila clavipes]|nr:hypothetical protein TNCV_1845691 [Trichonephila clavipes]
MLDLRIFPRLHHRLREARSFYVTRHDAGRRRAVRSPILEEGILNVVANRPESSTRVVAYYLSVSHQTVCVEQRYSNCSPWATCGLPDLFKWPAAKMCLASGDVTAVTKTPYETCYIIGNHMKPFTDAEIMKE